MTSKKTAITELLNYLEAPYITPMSGKRIREIRKSYGMTQVNFAKLLMVNYETYCSWEKGRRNPSSPGCAILSIAEKYPKVFLENSRDIVKELQQRGRLTS